MIIFNSLRQQCALLARSYPRLNQSKIQISRSFSVESLPHFETFSQIGVPDVLSKAAFNQAWTKYQHHLVSTLKRETAGSPDEFIPTLQVVYNSARDASKAARFNYASMAQNNLVFFSSLCPDTTQMPTSLVQHITGSFSSIDSFRDTFIASAAAMFGPGFVWLVKKNSGPTLAGQNLAILITYIAGSPYPRAHFRNQTQDMNTATTNVTNRMSTPEYLSFSQQAGVMGKHGVYASGLAPGGVELEVLLGVSTWEHVWLLDHGVGGKRRYLEALWDRIDWEVVDKRAQWSKLPSQGRYSRGS